MTGPIDLTTVAIIFVAGLLAIGATVWMLNRAWGDFPSRAGPHAGLPPTPLSPGPAQGRPLAPADDEEDEEGEEGAEDDTLEPDELPAGAPADGLVPVTHPLLLRAVQGAMERPGSPYSTYFISHGERVYLALYRIADPAERERARQLFEGLNGGDLGGLGMDDLMGVLRQLGK